MSRSIFLLFQVSDWCSYFCPDWIISNVARRLVTVFISTLCNAKTTLQILSRLRLYFWARLEICYSQSRNTKAPTLKVQVDRRIPIQITRRTFDIDSRGNHLRKGETCCCFESPGSPRTEKSSLTLASSRKIFFSCEEAALEAGNILGIEI